jgi:Cu/Ag efflux protein CusF
MRILRNKLLAAAVGAGISLTVSASAWACNTAEGAVAKIDTQGSAVLVNKTSDCCGGGAEQVKYVLKKDTKITVNGKEATLADLKAGDKIKIDYEKLDDVLALKVTRDS